MQSVEAQQAPAQLLIHSCGIHNSEKFTAYSSAKLPQPYSA